LVLWNKNPHGQAVKNVPKTVLAKETAPFRQRLNRQTSSNGFGVSDAQSAPTSFLNGQAEIIGLGMAVACRITKAV